MSQAGLRASQHTMSMEGRVVYALETPAWIAWIHAWHCSSESACSIWLLKHKHTTTCLGAYSFWIIYLRLRSSFGRVCDTGRRMSFFIFSQSLASLFTMIHVTHFSDADLLWMLTTLLVFLLSTCCRLPHSVYAMLVGLVSSKRSICPVSFSLLVLRLISSLTVIFAVLCRWSHVMPDVWWPMTWPF